MSEFKSGFFVGGGSCNGRVLVVDDEPDIRKVVRMTLQKAGYEVLEAENGEKAIETINYGENRLLLDVIICDIRMPKVNGIEAIAYFRQNYPRVPLIVLTGFPDTEMATLFVLAAVVLHTGKTGERPIARGLAGAAFLAAMFFKEPAVVLPGVLLVHDLLFRPSREPRVWVGRAAPYAAALAVYLALRIPALGGAAPVAAVENLGVLKWVASALALFLSYVWKTVAPIGLAFWTDFAPPASILDPRALGGLVVAGLLGWGGWVLRRRVPAVTFAIVLFTVPLAPALYLRGLNQGMEAAFAEYRFKSSRTHIFHMNEFHISVNSYFNSYLYQVTRFQVRTFSNRSNFLSGF